MAKKCKRLHKIYFVYTIKKLFKTFTGLRIIFQSALEEDDTNNTILNEFEWQRASAVLRIEFDGMRKSHSWIEQQREKKYFTLHSHRLECKIQNKIVEKLKGAYEAAHWRWLKRFFNEWISQSIQTFNKLFAIK